MTSTMVRPSASEKPRVFYAADAPRTTFVGHQIEKQTDGTAIVRGVQIFKAGTFRDSWGEQHTWEPDHLQQMVDHFTLLKANGIFPNPPVRRDHSMTIDKVMGYVENLYTAENGTKLVADVHATEPDDVDKLARGTYRSVSSEVGMYVTNAEAAYFPVLYGFAYVDIPAVEGLHGKVQTPLAYFSQMTPEEDSMTTQVSDKGVPNSVTLSFGSGIVSSGDPTPSTPPMPTAPPTPAPAPAPAPTPSTFRVNGAEVQDYAAVQRHIDVLEGVVKQNSDDSRKAFVAKLAADNKITAPQVTGLQEMALTFTDEQYAKFCETYEAATPVSLLQSHGGTNDGQPPADAAQVTSEQDEISVCEEQIALYRRARKSEEQIRETKAYKRLVALKAIKN